MTARPAAAVAVRFSRAAADIAAAHRLFVRRIGRRHVEDAASFRVSASVETADWIPRLGLAEHGGRLVAAQLGGLLPAVAMLSLPYTAVDESYEGQGVYLRLKQAMIAELGALARARGLPAPLGNVSEEAPGSAQYARKVGRGIAVAFPFPYAQPAVLGLDEAPLALTFEPLVAPPPAFTPADHRRIVAAVYRGLYRIADPTADPTFRRIAAAIARAADPPP
jgi:hypothetical protein